MKQIICLMLFIFLSNASLTAQMLPLSTSSDSARYYYYKGWEQVMDFGHYSNSAIAYKKCVEKDPDFLIGQCLYGRISSDLKEQEAIYDLIEQKKSILKGEEYQLLEVFHALLKLMIVRQKNPKNATHTLKTALALGEENLRTIVHKYPDEIYYKSEYIEILNYNHGAKTALDSLTVLATIKQQQNPFLLGYAAMLEAELGNFNIAMEKAKQLERYFLGQNIPKPFAVFADIYFKMDELSNAELYVDKALNIDAQCIDALRLKKKIKDSN